MHDCQARCDAERLAALELFEEELIDVAPAPLFARLQGFYYRVLGRVKVLGRMFVLGGIAAAYVAANLAKPQVHPTVAHLQTFLAALGRARAYVLYLIQMLALRAHTSSLIKLFRQSNQEAFSGQSAGNHCRHARVIFKQSNVGAKRCARAFLAHARQQKRRQLAPLYA
jgi:hypothetical protein